MSEPKPEESPSFLQKKFLGLPVWIYVAGTGIIIILFIYYKRKSSKTDASSTSSDTQSAATVPPFINQVYTQPTPPVTPTPTPKPPTPIPDRDDRKTKEETSTQAETIRKLAGQAKLPIDAFVQLNPDLARRYLGTGRLVPKGTKYKVYA